MLFLSIEPTNLCNRNCLHCLRNKADELESIPLETVDNILSQAKLLGMKRVGLTGGEVAIYPHLEGLVRMIVDYGFNFNMVTNGFMFKDRILPLLLEPKIRKRLDGVCFSLDGATAETHDALRGRGSFKEVMEAATLCRLKEIRVSLKSAITNFNKDEITELALLGATLGVEEQGFLSLYPTPTLIKKRIIPSPDELNRIVHWIMGSLARTVRTRIHIEGYSSEGVIFSCSNILHGINIDYQGNLILCCNLSHVTEDGKPTTFGDELLADLKEVSLREGIIRHFKAVARLMEARLRDMEKLSGLTYNPCYWCFKHFGKLDWLRDYPDSPWAEGMLKGA